MNDKSTINNKLRGPLEGEHGEIVARVVLNLTAYLHDVREKDLIQLIELYQKFSPGNGSSLYTITEFKGWASTDKPVVTDTVEVALAANHAWPALAPVFRRIQESRGFELRFWDGNTIEGEEGSWSFSCLKVLRRGRDPFCVVSFLLPADESPAILKSMACELAAMIPTHSGHGGLAFTYHPYRKIEAFEQIYALARRFWGIDVEDLNATVKSAGNSLKTLAWLTLLGRDSFPSSINHLQNLSEDSTIVRHDFPGNVLMQIGSAPDVFDIHSGTNNAYYLLARQLEQALPTEYPAFEGVGFGVDDSATTRWLRRFLEPDAWRL